MSRKHDRHDFPKQLIGRYPVTLSAADLLASTGEEAPEPIPFTPVPRQRCRRRGWSEERQRDFIACLQLTGSVSAAARAVRMSARTAYRLLHSEGADSFAEAWDRAFQEGVDRIRADALDRALHGSLVPIYRQGRLVRIEHRRNDRLAIALLGGRERAIDDFRRTAVSRRKYWEDMAALDAERAEEERRAEEKRRAHEEELERLAEKARSMSFPRVRSL